MRRLPLVASENETAANVDPVALRVRRLPLIEVQDEGKRRRRQGARRFIRNAG